VCLSAFQDLQPQATPLLSADYLDTLLPCPSFLNAMLPAIVFTNNGSVDYVGESCALTTRSFALLVRSL